MKVVVIATTNVRRMLRDRSNILFVFVLPIILVFVLGAVNSGAEPRLGLVVEGDGPRTAELADGFRALDGLTVRSFDDVDSAIAALRRNDVDGLLIVPADHDALLRAGDASVLRYAASPDDGFELRGMLEGVVAEQESRTRAALTAERLGLADFDEAFTAASAQPLGSAEGVSIVDEDGGAWAAGDRPLDQIAGQQLVLFTFITGLSAATGLIQTRQLGISRRMLASPTPVGTILAGEAAGRYLITLLQGVFIALATTVLFGVRWGSLLATSLLIAVFALVAAGAAMLLGVLFRNDAQAGGVALVLGITLAAFGGSMFPLELFPDGVRVAAHITPHAWANDAFTTIIRGGGGPGDVMAEVLVLLGYAAVLLAIAAALMRQRLSRAAPGQ